MAATFTFQFSIFLSLFLVSFLSVKGKIPVACQRYECPSYTVIKTGNDYEIRHYDSPVLISTNPIEDPSFSVATEIGFSRLFNYVFGNNTLHKQIKMTAPVASEVSGSGKSTSVTVSFYVPKENQANPPPADGLHVQRWKSTNVVAVRQYGGFVTDSNIGDQVAALKKSLAGTKWAATPETYTVAQYNSPYETLNRVNEIWFLYQ